MVVSRKRRRISAFGGIVTWFPLFLHLFHAPGYVKDAKAWIDIMRNSFPYLDWGLLIIGFFCFAYAVQLNTWPRRLLDFWMRRHPQTEEQPSTVPQPQPLNPNWTMHELFSHLWGDMYADRNDKLAEEIEDPARLGNLACWGRKYSSAGENPNPLRPIPKDHWDEFTLDFLRCRWSEDPSNCRTQPRSDHFNDKYADSFQDLRVNKSEAMALWPDRNKNP